jgi:hypothetical protein
LPFEPNLSGHEQQTANLDPEVEKLIRAYAASEAEGDPKKEKRLLKRYLKDSSFMKTMTDFKLHGPISLTYGGHLDFSELEEKQKKKE